MTLVNIDLRDIAGVPAGATVTFRAPSYRGGSGDYVVTPSPVVVDLVDGKGSAEIEPGPTTILIDRAVHQSAYVPDVAEVNLKMLLSPCCGGRPQGPMLPPVDPDLPVPLPPGEYDLTIRWEGTTLFLGTADGVDLQGPPGPKGDPGDASGIPAMFSGPSDPPDLVVGAKPGDTWLNTLTGDTFVLG